MFHCFKDYESCNSGISDDEGDDSTASSKKHKRTKSAQISRSVEQNYEISKSASVSNRLSFTSNDSGAGLSGSYSHQDLPKKDLHKSIRRMKSVLSKKPKQNSGKSAEYTDSFISDLFDGKLISSVQCLTCNTVSSRDEIFQDLSLPIPPAEVSFRDY